MLTLTVRTKRQRQALLRELSRPDQEYIHYHADGSWSLHNHVPADRLANEQHRQLQNSPQ